MMETVIVVVVVLLALLVVGWRLRKTLSGKSGCHSCGECGPRETDARDPPTQDATPTRRSPDGGM